MRKSIATLAFFFFTSHIFSQEWEELNPTDNLFNNTILALASDNFGSIYAAGQFTDSNSYYVVKVLINGKWSELGAPANKLKANGPIYAITFDLSGNLYAGGAFTNAAGLPYVAKWDGTKWSELGSGSSSIIATGQVYSLSVDKSGNIYAGGSLVDLLGKYYIAKWNGNTWTQLGTGSQALNANSLIYSVVPDSAGNVYAAGQFTDNQGKYYIAKWNGNSWGTVGTGSEALNANSYINSIAIDGVGNIYSGGAFTNAAGQPYVVKWDGTVWTELGTGASSLNANGSINSILVDRLGQINVGGRMSDVNGSYYIARWNGSTWSNIPGTSAVWPVNNYISSICNDPLGNLYAAGDFTDINGDRYVAKLSGTTWTEPGINGSKFPTQANPIHAVANDTAGDVFTVLGDVDQAGIPIVERWDGHTWTKLITSISTGYITLNKLAPDSLGNMYACGNFSGSNGVAKWNGTGWTVLPTSSGQLTVNSINNIGTDKKGNVYISGSFSQNGYVFTMAKWDGSVWTGFATDLIYYFIVDPSGTVYAANEDFSNTGLNVLKITTNSRTWIGAGISNNLNANSWVQAMVFDSKGNLYAGGGFANSSGNAYVAKWNGTSWTELGTGSNSFGASGTIYGLAFDKSGNLFASGNLMQHSGTYLGKWNDSTWSQMATGNAFWYQNNIDFLSSDNRGNIFAGGEFNGSRNLGNYIYEYQSSSTRQPVVCMDSASIQISASELIVTNQTSVINVTAHINSIGSLSSTFEFSMDRNFSSLLEGPSSDSSLSINPKILLPGSNTIYVQSQTTGKCNNILTNLDSISIIKKIAGGLIDIDYPNTSIIAYPNPFEQFINISGLNIAKSYRLNLYNIQGAMIKEINLSGESGIRISTSTFLPGVYSLKIYDNTKNRKIGIVSLLKAQ